MTTEDDIRRYLIELAPSLARLRDIETEMDQAKNQFLKWFTLKFAGEMEEVRVINEKLEETRTQFNVDISKLYFAGHRDFFDRSVQPRTIRRVSYPDPKKFQEWAWEYPDMLILNTHVEELRQATGIIYKEGRLDLLTVDIKIAEKLASSVYDDGTPVYTGPFKVESTMSQTSMEKLTKLITTFGIEQEFDDRNHE